MNDRVNDDNRNDGLKELMGEIDFNAREKIARKIDGELVYEVVDTPGKISIDDVLKDNDAGNGFSTAPNGLAQNDPTFSRTESPRRVEKPYDETSTVGFGDLASKNKNVKIGEKVVIVGTIENAMIGDLVEVEQKFEDGVLAIKKDEQKCYIPYNKFRIAGQSVDKRDTVVVKQNNIHEIHDNIRKNVIEDGVADSLGYDLKTPEGRIAWMRRNEKNKR